MTKYGLILPLVLFLMSACGQKSVKEGSISDFGGIAPIEWAKKLADSDQQRNPDPVFLDHSKKPKWNYTQGLVTLANQKLYDYTRDQRYWDYGLSFADQMIDESGDILGGYELERYSLDLVNSGKLLFEIYKKTGEQRYKNAMDTLHKQLETHPRNSDGGYWHKKKITLGKCGLMAFIWLILFQPSMASISMCPVLLTMRFCKLN